MEQHEHRINLAGIWRCRLDPDDQGTKERWYAARLPHSEFRLPGTTNENHWGDPLAMEPSMNKESVRSLRQHHRYVGAAWYQREIVLPPEWSRKAIVLFLERVMVQSQVWIDDQPVGACDSLSVPHQYHLTPYAAPGSTHRLTIRIDNRDVRQIGTYPSAYTDETQTIWNGIVGTMELRAEEPVHCRTVQIHPDLTGHKIKADLRIDNHTGSDADVRITLQARLISGEAPHQAPPVQARWIVPAGGGTFSCEVWLGDEMRLWDEFTPNLYELRVALHADNGTGSMTSEKTASFGMREFKREGTQFAVNGRTCFLRGTLDCCIFPLTGYPPTDLASWERICRVLQSYGLNHLRFHSWCPPEAAFLAADRAGLYLQVEGPVWMDTWNGYPVGSREDHYDYLPAEALRIHETYGNHPSFCLFSNGNELKGDFALLHDMIVTCKQADGRKVYTLTSNWDRELDPADDFFVAQTVDGVGVRGQYFLNDLTGGTELDYAQAVAKRNVPVVSHEVGQYTVYPNVAEIAKYTGALRPFNLETIKLDLEKKGLLEDAADFTHGSGKLAVQLYREEIEAALRTKGLGGFQLLDLHDFPGQSSATIGILDCFWDSKGLIEPEAFRRFCGPTVLLLRMPKRIYARGETFKAKPEIAHYGKEDIKQDRLLWTLTGSSGGVIASGEIPASLVPAGGVYTAEAEISADLAAVAAPDKVAVTLALEEAGITNSWDVWVYPGPDSRAAEEQPAGRARIASKFDDGVERALADGWNVLLLPPAAAFGKSLPGKFYPVFWSPVHFASESPCGIHVAKNHPALRDFPTESYAEFQWEELLENSVSINLDALPREFRPIVQVIPNFYHNHKLGNLLEAKVGAGRLLICSIDLVSRLDERLAAGQLRRSLLSYLAEADRLAYPAARLSPEQVKALFLPDEQARAERAPIRKNLALGKPAYADSEKSPEYAAAGGNDGIAHTRWRAADEQPGHWWMVDLGAVRQVTGTKVTFAREANYLYVIQVSEDGADWRIAVNQTGQTSSEQCRTDLFAERARFVKIVYNGLPPGVAASHSGFEVFGY